MKKCILYKKLGNNIVECTACSHYCKISENKTGICGVRKNQMGDLYLLVYGKAAAAHVDPIEKKPLFHFLPGTRILSVGTIGCNFACEFCQNWDISQATKKVKEQYKNPDEQMIQLGKMLDMGQELPPEKIVKYAVQNGIKSIAYTYNEPVIFFEYIYDTAKLAHAKGISNVFVSNGYESEEAMKKINPYLDAINIDLKSFSEDFYRKKCKARLEPVLETIKRAHRSGIWVEITTLVIPGENDSDEELKKIAEFIADVNKSIPWHVSRFRPDYKMMDKEATPVETLERAYMIGREAGLKYVFTGNIHDGKEDTYCPKCDNKLVERSVYEIEIKGLEKGKCKECRTRIAGVW